MKKRDKEYGSKVNLVSNMAGAGNEELEPDTKDNKLEPAPILADTGASSERKMLRQETLEERVLTPDEKSFLLCVERGDVSTAKGIIKAMTKRPNLFDLNCVDPLGRSALVIAVENENMPLMEMLLEAGIRPKDALLVSIREDYVDGCEMLLRFEEETHKEGEAYSWETMDNTVANFTADITPLILAAHRNNYEILKMLLDRGATIPIPHYIKCSCQECLQGSEEDSLKFSLARINAYRALASPSLIALSSRDPILTAFQLSDELKKLARAESQYRAEYIKLRKQVQEFVCGLIDQTRTSYELEVILNHNPDGEPWQIGDYQTLDRLKLAVAYKQKKFVAHPSVQQLLASIWYEGLPGFRRKHVVKQMIDVAKLFCMFPINSMLYIMAPHSGAGKHMRKPFVKFVSHSASYIFFLLLLALASQRIEHVMISLICYLIPGTEWLAQIQADWIKYERGSLPHFVEMLIILWVQGFAWSAVKTFYSLGLLDYIKNVWNLADVFIIGSFMTWIGLRALAFLIVLKEQWDGVPPEQIWIPKEEWHVFEPQLLAEAMFGAGMVSAYLKVVHILSINPHMGPLQIALGKMVIDILKWMFLYMLVVFAFGCGMNQLLWYYADLEYQACYSLPGGEPDYENEGDACGAWRRFANLWETSQSLFWSTFGLVEISDFDLQGIKEFTRFWGLLMFGSYSVCNIIVALNMLIAMMSNSYQVIFERSDMEWKFSRSKLWMAYFNPGSTVPPPFNVIPSPKSIMRILCCKKAGEKNYSEEDVNQANDRYFNVMKFIIRRYVTNEQRKSEDYSITEDDIQEVRQDISSFKYELLDILRNNKMDVPATKGGGIVGRKSKNMERQIQKGFNISHVENIMDAFSTAILNETPKDVFKKFAKIVGDKKRVKQRASIKRDADSRRSSLNADPIGSSSTSIRRHRNSLKKSMLCRGASAAEMKMTLTRLNSTELVAFNPLLADVDPMTRRAYAKFKSTLNKYNLDHAKGQLPVETELSQKREKKNRDSIRKLIIEKAKSIDSVSSHQSVVNKLVADLDKFMDKEPTENQSNLQKKETTTEGVQEKPNSDDKGIDNKAFTADDSSAVSKPAASTVSPMAPPSPRPSPKPDHATAKTSDAPELAKAAPAKKAPAPSKPETSACPSKSPAAAPPKSPAAPPRSPAAPPKSPAAPPKSPAPPPKSPAAPPKSAAGGKPAAEASTKKPAMTGATAAKSPAPVRKDEEPVGKFEPDGKSAVSGQKRTGWI